MISCEDGDTFNLFCYSEGFFKLTKLKRPPEQDFRNHVNHLTI